MHGKAIAVWLPCEKVVKQEALSQEGLFKAKVTYFVHIDCLLGTSLRGLTWTGRASVCPLPGVAYCGG